MLLQAPLHGLEQAAFAELAPSHDQVVGRFAVEHARQQALAAEEHVLASAAARLVGRDARDLQLQASSRSSTCAGSPPISHSV